MEKPTTKLNRLYKKWEKAKEDRSKTEDEIKAICTEIGVDYGIYMQYMSGDPTTVALVQSIATSFPVVEDIKKEDKRNGNSKETDNNKRTGRGGKCQPEL